jgi:hypothetical protein
MKLQFRRRGSASLSAIARGTSSLVQQIGGGAAALAQQVPATLETTVGGGVAAAKALQRLNDPTLRWLAAGSIGLGAGLYLSGSPRLVVAASVMPALLIGAAILLRPVALTQPR